MYYKKVKFVDIMDENDQLDPPLGGIGIFEDDKLIGVLYGSGECGSFIEADAVSWYEVME